MKTTRAPTRRPGLSSKATVLSRLVLLLSLSSLSSGCVARYSVHEIDGTWYDDKLERGWVPPLELGLMTSNIPIGPSAVAISVEVETQDLDFAAVPPVVDWESLSMTSFTVGGRFFPLNLGPVLPYAGGGYGRTKLSGRWTGPNYDPAPGTQCFGDCQDTYTETLFSGYHPHLVGGLEVRGSGRTSFMVEYRKDFDRGDDFYRLSGQRVSFGLRWRVEGR